MKGKIIIDFESNRNGECIWDIKQEGESVLDDENIVSLFEHIIREKIKWE